MSQILKKNMTLGSTTVLPTADKWWFDSLTVKAKLLTILPIITLVLNLLHVPIVNDDITAIIDALAALAGATGIIIGLINRMKSPLGGIIWSMKRPQ